MQWLCQLHAGVALIGRARVMDLVINVATWGPSIGRNIEAGRGSVLCARPSIAVHAFARPGLPIAMLKRRSNAPRIQHGRCK